MVASISGFRGTVQACRRQVLARLCARMRAEMMRWMRLPWIAASGISLLIVCGAALLERELGGGVRSLGAVGA